MRGITRTTGTLGTAASLLHSFQHCLCVLALTASAALADGLSQYLDRGYVIAADQSIAGLRVFAADTAGESSVVWQWRAATDASFTGGANGMRYLADVKVRNGGRTVLACAATDWAVIDAKTSTTLRSGNCGDNGHSIELLPDGTIVKADSTGQDVLRLILTNGTVKTVYSLTGAHGVEWDDTRLCLWALGTSKLARLSYDADAKTLTEEASWTGYSGGHSLFLGADGIIYATDWYGIYAFNPDTGVKTTLYNTSNSKSFDRNATFGDLVQTPTDGNYSADRLTVYPVSGQSYQVSVTGASMYHVRWLVSTPAIFTGGVIPPDPVQLGPARAVVKDNGARAVLSVRVDGLAVPSATLSLLFGGTVVTNWAGIAEGRTYSASVPTTPGTNYVFSFTADIGEGVVATANGLFTASAVDGWFNVDFADTGYEAGTNWMDTTFVSNPSGTWSAAAGNTSTLVEATGSAPRHVEIDGGTPIIFTPTTPSDTGADVAITGRVSVAASDDLPEVPQGVFASLYFLEDNGAIHPCGYANGSWTVFESRALTFGTWVEYAMEIDQTSVSAPRIRFLIDGVALVAGGVSWLPLGTVPDHVSNISFKGFGGVGGFHGHFKSAIVAEIEVPVIGGGAGGGNGLAFGTDPTTGRTTFSATVTNPMAGIWYTAYTSTNLTETFRAEFSLRALATDEALDLIVDASVPTKFVKVVASRERPELGAALE